MPDAVPLSLPGLQNVRDLGGLPTGEGRIIEPGLVYRSEVLAGAGGSHLHAVWDQARAEPFERLGLKTVVDLRSDHEAEKVVSAWHAATGADAIRLPIEEGGEGSDTNYIRELAAGTISRFGPEDLAAFYRDVLDRRGAVFAQVIELLSHQERLPLLIHCSAGKDRTGLVVALLLDLLGAPRELIVQDYELTGKLRPNRVEAYRHLFDPIGIPLEDVSALFESPASAMEAALMHLDTAYGGTAAYLRTHGLDDVERERILGLITRP